MGTHRRDSAMTIDRPARRPGVTRVLGRGAVATSAALALAGSGAGLALATPGHGDHGDDGHGSHSSGHGHGSSDRSSASCDTGEDGLVGGLLGDLGLGDGHARDSSSDRCDTESSSSSSDSSSDDAGSSTQQASSTSVQRTPQADPRNEPPEPGETKTLRIPTS